MDLNRKFIIYLVHKLPNKQFMRFVHNYIVFETRIICRLLLLSIRLKTKSRKQDIILIPPAPQFLFWLVTSLNYFIRLSRKTPLTDINTTQFSTNSLKLPYSTATNLASIEAVSDRYKLCNNISNSLNKNQELNT